MDIQKAGSVATVPQPSNAVTGQAWRADSFRAPAPGQLTGATVSFAPGARTAWHTHPLGQVLIVTSGVGWVQTLGGPKQTVQAGDIISFSAGEKHWHGATDTSAMTHIALVESEDGAATTDWMEHVTNAEYLA